VGVEGEEDVRAGSCNAPRAEARNCGAAAFAQQFVRSDGDRQQYEPSPQVRMFHAATGARLLKLFVTITPLAIFFFSYRVIIDTIRT
jgi:hypothetical protein